MKKLQQSVTGSIIYVEGIPCRLHEGHLNFNKESDCEYTRARVIYNPSRITICTGTLVVHMSNADLINLIKTQATRSGLVNVMLGETSTMFNVDNMCVNQDYAEITLTASKTLMDESSSDIDNSLLAPPRPVNSTFVQQGYYLPKPLELDEN